jgi:hypothetical protein
MNLRQAFKEKAKRERRTRIFFNVDKDKRRFTRLLLCYEVSTSCSFLKIRKGVRNDK